MLFWDEVRAIETLPDFNSVLNTCINSSTNSNNIHSSEVQNIKVEPDLVQRSGGGVIATVTTAVDEEDDSSNSEYFLADLRKRKHSPSSIEQTLSLTTKKESTACS